MIFKTQSIFQLTHFSRVDFEYMMSRLPVYVSEQDIEEMFTVADRDKDGKISYQEFLVSGFVQIRSKKALIS